MKRKIIVHDYAGHPFQIQLSRALARRGNEVLHVYYGHNNTPKGDLNHRVGDPRTLDIHPVYTKQPLEKYAYFKRFFQENEYGRNVSEIIKKFQPDVVLSANTPLNAQKAIIKKTRQSNARFIFWLQDVLGLASLQILKQKLPILGFCIGKYYVQLERQMIKQSDQVVLISDDFSSIVTNWGVPKEAIEIIPNWAPLGDIPVHHKENAWSKRFSFHDKFCFIYTGTLGLKHNPDLLLRLAIIYKDQNDVRLIVISEGPGAIWLKKASDELKLNNLIIMDYQPYEKLPFVLATGDVLIAILDSSSGPFSVPSKVLTYLCAQRPLLLAVPDKNYVARIVQNHEMGLVCLPDDVDMFLENAKKLRQSSGLRHQFAKNARAYAEETFDIERICDRFEEIL